MKYLKLVFLSLFLLAPIAGASSVNLTFTTLPTTYKNSTYNGFVGGILDAGPGAAQLFDDLVCDDFLAVTYVPSGPDPYKVEALPAPFFTGGKFGIGYSTQYKAAALLINGDGGALLGLSHVTSPDDVTSYQYAIWRLFTSDSAIGQELSSGGTVDFGTSSALMAEALLDVNSNSERFLPIYDDLRIYTPDPIPGGPQEFLQIDGSPSVPSLRAYDVILETPEPFSLLLIGVGLIVLTLVSRRFIHWR